MRLNIYLMIVIRLTKKKNSFKILNKILKILLIIMINNNKDIFLKVKNFK